MSAPDALTPTQFQLMVVAWDLADQVPPLSACDVNHAAREGYGYRGHQTIVRLLKLLVDRGYLTRDSDAGGRRGPYPVVPSRRRSRVPPRSLTLHATWSILPEVA